MIPLAKHLEDVITGVELQRQSFIIKIWLEPPEQALGQARWRGRITHVSSGDSRYVDDMEEITWFIAKYLRDLGAHVKFRHELRDWLSWLNRCRQPRNRSKGEDE